MSSTVQPWSLSVQFLGLSQRNGLVPVQTFLEIWTEAFAKRFHSAAFPNLVWKKILCSQSVCEVHKAFSEDPPRATIFIQIDQDSGLGRNERSPLQSPQVCFESFLESWQSYKCTNRVENWFCRDTKVGKSTLTHLPLSSGEKQKFFYKRNICLITISPFIFILDINTLNVAKCILLHRTESIPDTQTLAQNPSDSSPRARIYFSSNVNSSQFQCCSS